MPRAYPPIWCAKEDCKNCDFLECDLKVLNLFNPYKYPSIDFTGRPKHIDPTSIAIYFGYCQRLAKFFLMFAQIAPISPVENNFFTDYTGLPAKVSIQRILLDMLNHGDAEAPTDEVHKLRLMMGMKLTKSKHAKISVDGEEKEITISEQEIEEFWKLAKDLERKILAGEELSFDKTEKLIRCNYCFLLNCEEI